jgi:peptidoglycan/LPS O-acetylase OafA/YrhL
LRLGIPYWITLAFVVALDFVADYLWFWPSLIDDPVEWPQLTANLAFLQDVLGYGNISAGTWFVCIDLQIGLLFVGLLWVAQRLSPGLDRAKPNALALAVVFLPIGLLSLFVFGYDDQYDMWAIYFFSAPLLGAIIWWTLEKRLPSSVFWVYALTMAGSLAYHWRLETAIALGAGLVIYAVGCAGHLGDWLSNRVLQYFGRISYSLFLIHYAIGWLVVTIGHWYTSNHPVVAVWWLLAALLASIGAAHLVYMFIEAPSVRLTQHLKAKGAFAPRRALPEGQFKSVA